MSFWYVASSQKSTAVTASLICELITNNEKNLVITKGNSLEIYGTTNNNLNLLFSIPLFGNIATVLKYKTSNYSANGGSNSSSNAAGSNVSNQLDSLLIITRKGQYFCLSYDTNTNKFETVAVGPVTKEKEKYTIRAETTVIDPDGRVACIDCEGHLKLIPIEAAGFKEAFHVSFNDGKIIDIQFLHNCNRPTLIVLYEDNKQSRHVKTVVIDLKERDAISGSFALNYVEFAANKLIPVASPVNGVLVVGAVTITYISISDVDFVKSSKSSSSGSSYMRTCEIQRCIMMSSTAVSSDGKRYLLGDSFGNLISLALVTNKNPSEVEFLAVDYLGVTSTAETISYLGTGVVYIGSTFGDSQLLKLHPNNDSSRSCIEVMDIYAHIGPILDMCLVDNEKNGGQKQLVTCSGAFKDGSLRIIKSGIGIIEQASTEVSGVTGLWSLRTSLNATYHKFLVQSFFGETRILSIEDEEMSEVEIAGFDSMQRTLYCGNMQNNILVQVTIASVRLVDSDNFNMLFEYLSPGNITVAAGNCEQIIIAISGGQLQYLELDDTGRALEVKQSIVLDQDVACLSLLENPNPAEKMDVDESDAAQNLLFNKSTLLALAMWTDHTVRLLALPNFQEVNRVMLGSETQARDIMLATLEDKTYLMVGLGDGHIITYNVDFSTDLPTVKNMRKGVVGTHPISFKAFQFGDEICIFAACDRSTILYSRNGKLLFSVLNVNMSDIISVTTFHSELFPECLVLSSEAGFMIGTIEDIQKMHIQTIPLGETPRRIAHNTKRNVYAVCTEKNITTNEGNLTISKVIFYDDTSMEMIGFFELDVRENALSCISCVFDESIGSDSSEDYSSSQADASGYRASNVTQEYIVIGTAHAEVDAVEPSKGRILVFDITNENGKKPVLVTEKEIKGAAFTLASINGRIAAGINSKVEVFKLVKKDDATLPTFSSQPDLVLECSHSGHILILQLKAKGNLLLVGDAFRSMAVLQHRPEDGSLTEIGRDSLTSEVRAAEILELEDHFLACDAAENLYCVKRNTTGSSEEDRTHLDQCGEFGLGDAVNVICRGALTGQPIETESSNLVESSESKAECDIIFSNDYISITGLAPTSNSIVYGTVTGAIGCVLGLNDGSYRFFSAVEKAMKATTVSIGGLSHQRWRRLDSRYRTAPQRGFIDGDLVESFLDLCREDSETICRIVNDELNNFYSVAPTNPDSMDVANTSSTSSATASAAILRSEKVNFAVEDILQRIEDISRLH